MIYVSWSGGKDSTASVILCHELGIAIDEIIFSEVMYDMENGLSGEDPEHIRFVKEKAIPMFESWGYTVTIVSAGDYLSLFKKEIARGPRKGKLRGYPLPRGMCWVKRDLKLRPLREYLKGKSTTAIIGIAADEPNRIQSLKENEVSVLNEFGYTERDAYELCRKYDLLSPIYSKSSRGGCWFCPNAKLAELKAIRDEHPKLWASFRGLSKTPNLASYIYKYGKTFEDIEKEIEEVFLV